jgi:hypothetical protein
MQARGAQGGDLVAGSFIHLAVLRQGTLGNHQGAKLLEVSHRGCNLDLRKRCLTVVAFDEGGHFGGPYAGARHVSYALFS